MDNDQAVARTRDFVEQKFSQEGSGHDWWHMYRVWQLAKTIAQGEAGADMLVVELAALLHDVADSKLAESEAAGREEIAGWLQQLELGADVVDAVLGAVQNVSFSSSIGTPADGQHSLSLEAQIVSDADKLDALGAIGIARAFAYGGHKQRMLYDPARPPETYADAAAYHSNDTPTINHFYDKLLLLKDSLHTATARQLAGRRHQYMEQFLEEFYAEWEGKQ